MLLSQLWHIDRIDPDMICDRWKHAITISPMSSAATPKKEAKVHHSRHTCLLGFVGLKTAPRARLEPSLRAP